MKKSFLLWFLYRTIPGRIVLKLLVQPWISRLFGYFLSSGVSRWLIPYYIWKHKIDLSDIKIPQNGFLSFNEFFTRERNIMYYDMTKGHLISPCDGFLTYTKIQEDKVLDIKNTKYSLKDLLADEELAVQFYNGDALVFRMTPANFHRYCYAADGKILFSRKIQGKLHCVRPIALQQVPVFVQNCREYLVYESADFGKIIQMEIGALLVGKIKNHKHGKDAGQVQVGEEKGYFEFGGSTILLLFQKNVISFREELYNRQSQYGESPVHMGDFVARLKF